MQAYQVTSPSCQWAELLIGALSKRVAAMSFTVDDTGAVPHFIIRQGEGGHCQATNATTFQSLWLQAEKLFRGGVWGCHGNTLMASVALTLAMCRSECCALRRRAILVGWVCTFWRAHSWRFLLHPGQYLIYGHRWGAMKQWHEIRQLGWAVQQDSSDGSEEVMVHAGQFDCPKLRQSVKRDGLVVGDQIRFIVLPPRQGKLHGRAGDINELIRSGQPRCRRRSPRRAPSPTVNIVGTSVSFCSFRPRQNRPCAAPPVVKADDEQDDDVELVKMGRCKWCKIRGTVDEAQTPGAHHLETCHLCEMVLDSLEQGAVSCFFQHVCSSLCCSCCQVSAEGAAGKAGA